MSGCGSNLSKVQERWANPSDEPLQFDQEFPESERFPRRIEVELTEVVVDGRPKVRVSINGELLGSPLGDNAYDPDGYRFHDVFHLAYAAVLGWSPNLRAFLKRKRKSNPLLDEVEDGGRARVLEEGVSALVFDYARVHEILNGVTDIDYRLLRTIKSMITHLEVDRCTISDWQRAILDGFAVWREVLRDKGGRVLIDLDERKSRSSDQEASSDHVYFRVRTGANRTDRQSRNLTQIKNSSVVKPRACQVS